MKHLQKLNMSYFQHMRIALYYSWWLFLASVVLVIHSVFPFWFERTGSNIVSYLYIKFNTKKNNG